MKFKNLPAWLKGGIIGLIIGILFILGAYFYQWWVDYTAPTIPPVMIEKPNILKILLFLPFILPFIIASLILFLLTGLENEYPITIFIGLIVYFLIGAFIGWIVGKVRKRKLKIN